MRLSRDRRARRYIRESAVVLVVRILKRYGAAYPSLIPRTMRTLLHALLDPSKVCWRTRFLYPVLFISFVGVWCVFCVPRASYSPVPQPFCTHFGALSAISTMSPHSTATLLLPHMLPYVVIPFHQQNPQPLPMKNANRR